MLNLIEEAEQVIRQAAADNLLAQLLPALYRTGWDATAANLDGHRILIAHKGAGWIFLPGGRDGRWRTQIAEMELVDTTPDDLRGLTPEFTDRKVWHVEMDQCTPIDVILTVAERAAAGPGRVSV